MSERTYLQAISDGLRDEMRADERVLCLGEDVADFGGAFKVTDGFLEEFGWRENTLVILVSDNGASGEGGPNGSVNEMKFANGIPDTVEANMPLLDDLGSPKTYNHYPTGWAWAFNAPYKMFKRYSLEGGIAEPFHRLGVILLHALPVLITDAEIALRLRIAHLRGEADIEDRDFAAGGEDVAK